MGRKPTGFLDPTECAEPEPENSQLRGETEENVKKLCVAGVGKRASSVKVELRHDPERLVQDGVGQHVVVKHRRVGFGAEQLIEQERDVGDVYEGGLPPQDPRKSLLEIITTVQNLKDVADSLDGDVAAQHGEEYVKVGDAQVQVAKGAQDSSCDAVLHPPQRVYAVGPHVQEPCDKLAKSGAV